MFSNDFNKQDYKHKLLSLITYDKNVEAKKQELLPTFFFVKQKLHCAKQGKRNQNY